MNIIDAIKSGKKFRHVHDQYKFEIASHWEKDMPPTLHKLDRDGMWVKVNYFSIEEILSDEWIIENEKIEITKNMMRQILVDDLGRDDSINRILANMGFKE